VKRYGQGVGMSGSFLRIAVGKLVRLLEAGSL
jgi:hypothetical protein